MLQVFFSIPVTHTLSSPYLSDKEDCCALAGCTSENDKKKIKENNTHQKMLSKFSS